MRVFGSIEAISAEEFVGGTVLAIGKFDGVHRGHRVLIDRVREIAKQQCLEPLVFTFANNPLSLLRPDLCPPNIMSREQRMRAFAAEGVAACVMVLFDPEFAEITAEDFVEGVLVAKLHVKHICVGADFRFGEGGLGDPALLEAMGQRLGFRVEIIDSVEDPQLGRISSTNVRAAILRGDVASASRMMGRLLAIRGTVVHGDARGRELGFPTANLGCELEGLRPADGVYAGWALVGEKLHKAAISVGANVTFDPDGEPRVEAHLLDFAGDLYGQRIELRFVARLRGMVAFPSVEALLMRMREDVEMTYTILAGENA